MRARIADLRGTKSTGLGTGAPTVPVLIPSRPRWRAWSSLSLSVSLALSVSVSVLGGGCYSPEPLDARAMLTELRQGPPPAGGVVMGGPAVPADVTSGAALSEDRSIAVALLWNRELRAYRLTRGMAEGEVVTAGALNNPEIRMELTHLQRQNLSQLGWDLRLSWEPPRPGVRAGERGAAAARLDEVDKQVMEREWALACDIRTAHATLLALDQEIRVAQDTVANRRRLAEVVSRRVERGGTTRFDLDLVRLSLASSQHAEAQRRLERTLAANALVQLLGVGPPGGDVTVTGELGETVMGGAPQGTQVELEDRALANRPALAAARARHRASEETLRAETAARWPWFRFSAAPRIRRNEFYGAATDLVFGVDVMLPIFNTNRGKVQSARAARQVARAEVTSALAGLRADIARALSTVEAQRANLHRLQTEIAPLLAEHDRVLTAAAQASELDLPSLIASENLVLASRTQLINAQLDLRKAWISLERAVGTAVSPTATASPEPPVPGPPAPGRGK